MDLCRRQQPAATLCVHPDNSGGRPRRPSAAAPGRTAGASSNPDPSRSPTVQAAGVVVKHASCAPDYEGPRDGRLLCTLSSVVSGQSVTRTSAVSRTSRLDSLKCWSFGSAPVVMEYTRESQALLSWLCANAIRLIAEDKFIKHQP